MRQIIVSKPDAQRLRAVLRAHRHAHERDLAHLHDLEAELDRAAVMEAGDVPASVVTMQAAVEVEDVVTGERREYVLAFPHEADAASRRISVLAPLGTALLGYRERDEIVWRMPGGVRRLRIRKVAQDPTGASMPSERIARDLDPRREIARWVYEGGAGGDPDAPMHLGRSADNPLAAPA